jgi:hypothetical protein
MSRAFSQKCTHMNETQVKKSRKTSLLFIIFWKNTAVDDSCDTKVCLCVKKGKNNDPSLVASYLFCIFFVCVLSFKRIAVLLFDRCMDEEKSTGS